MSDTELLTLDAAKQHYHGRLEKLVLEWLSVMDRIVNSDKQPPTTPVDWEPLGDLVDRQTFRRVGNYGVRNDWESYKDLLALWANHSWWKGYIWRMREVPGANGNPSLVYLETEERSNTGHPVQNDGDYETLASISVYEIDVNDKITRLHVYDQRPL